ncbi:MAG: TlyA family RNA methyltransferase [Zymomonas mobilis subsp. pomaceae]|uniref:Hemolysin A n=1 Tax=Zymomonas mobilis subsp. pomaceae (strain ATCC 29192 / DSM 22645 / JCM 10191 / CCUG 17912 / NBRC 13757 / NCIMB 11200 / NRRL B-4491 / Barker I) TaxID=579138 RepID=F8ET47_ZYMMT|nr:TlyA family RNA methyltransferase [Zymomonas mobilis]AEI36937.1 hemolysin A [Zymomonas mobilis subsp. pomaceae ATCC 29192]MDX5948310.1 TlyA family RNA methyltransferase [Zymomonas mobilis subsp. pomaceae]GEB89065.1 TlyA family rRNA (cytidine-2'-O)-methyltransferase [Zymomonas mobilis subsp. pomaceae]
MANKTKKKRVDQLLVERGLVENTILAQALLMAGHVWSEDRRIEKAGQILSVEAPLRLKGKEHPWVSRGGVKLAHGLKYFGWKVEDYAALDVGSSTGGFTDVLLQSGARRVYAVDSGTNQLAWKLRQDPRVVVYEQLSARLLTAEHIPEAIDLVVCDVSFISLTKILEKALSFAKIGGKLLALIKPQFEAGRDEVAKGGIVRDPDVHKRVCLEVTAWLEGLGWHSLGIERSPITGHDGNIEFLIAAEKQI